MVAISKTKEARRERLLAAGFFPEELPPPFTTDDLLRSIEISLLKVLNTIPRI